MNVADVDENVWVEVGNGLRHNWKIFVQRGVVDDMGSVAKIIEVLGE